MNKFSIFLLKTLTRFKEGNLSTYATGTSLLESTDTGTVLVIFWYDTLY